MLNLRDPFFNPLSRRIIVTLICLGWGLFEIIGGSAGWAMLFGGLGLYCIYIFFVSWVPVDEKDKKNG